MTFKKGDRVVYITNTSPKYRGTLDSVCYVDPHRRAYAYVFWDHVVYPNRKTTHTVQLVLLKLLNKPRNLPDWW